MAEFLRNHPIKITVATAIVVLGAIVSATYAAGLKDADIDNRVSNIEKDFVEYELKEVPTMKVILERVDENVEKLLNKK